MAMSNDVTGRLPSGKEINRHTSNCSTATACITSGVVSPHAIQLIMPALAVSVVKDNLQNSISFHAEPRLWPDTSLLHP